MENEEWLSVAEYAKLMGKSEAQIYLDLRTGKIEPSRTRKVKVDQIRTREITQIKN